MVAKIAVFFGFMISFCQILSVQFDVVFTKYGISIELYWYSLQVIQLCYVFIICPLLLLYYEGNEHEPIFKRLINAIKVQLPMFLFLIFMITVSFFGMPDYYLKQDVAVMYGYELNGFHGDEPVYYARMDFALATYVVLCWVGMLLFAIFGSIGLIYMPYDYLNEFIFRPKPIQQADFIKRKKVLLPMVIKLRKQGKEIEDQRYLVE